MGVIRQPEVKSHDPKGINSHLKVQFLDVIAEPKGAHSCSCIWQASHCCYQFCFSLCYGCSVAFNHLCVSPLWGIQFAYLSFVHVWVATPFVKCVGYVLHVPAMCYRICTRCVVDPWCEASAYLFMFFETPPDVKKEGRGDWVPMSMY